MDMLLRRRMMMAQMAESTPKHTQDGVILDSWEEIIQNIHDGKAKEYYALGDTKALDMGTEGIINMQIVGFDVDDLADGSGKAKTSWLSKELMKTGHRWNPGLVNIIDGQQEGTGTIGGWLNCELRNYYQTIIKPKIVPNVLSAVKLVTKTHPAYRSGASSAISFTQTTTEDIWIPSYSEMFDFGIYTSWFKDNESRKKIRVGQTGSNRRWWLRSASGNNSAGSVGSGGDYGGKAVSGSYLCVLGFCI